MIKPDDLKADRDREAVVQAEKVEAVIDRVLRDQYEGYGRPVSVDYPTDTRRHVVEYVLTRYRQNGWHVEETSDQRDGRYIVFTHFRPVGDGR